MSGIILVLNAGSSSLKFAAYEASGPELAARYAGQMEGIGAAPHFLARDAQGAVLAERRWTDTPPPAGHGGALGVIIDWLQSVLHDRPVIAIGHRVVHGGSEFTEPMLIDLSVLAELQELVPLAPLHQPHNLAGIAAAAKRFRGVPQIACFDTAFHRGQPWEAEVFALPGRFYDQGIRRYGFHGLSYEYIARRMAAEDPVLGEGRIIVAHLGNGDSLCAIDKGRSIATTMGFTALDGLPMGTRCGQIDPGVILHMLGSMGMSLSEVTHLLYNDSGLKGLSGLSQDVRELEHDGNPAAERALGHFAYRVRREIGAMAATLGGVDALVFTAGIGENDAALRARICDRLGFLGIAIDPQRNERRDAEISPPGAAVKVLVRHTDEERMIAEHTQEVVAASWRERAAA